VAFDFFSLVVGGLVQNALSPGLPADLTYWHQEWKRIPTPWPGPQNPGRLANTPAQYATDIVRFCKNDLAYLDKRELPHPTWGPLPPGFPTAWDFISNEAFCSWLINGQLTGDPNADRFLTYLRTQKLPIQSALQEYQSMPQINGGYAERQPPPTVVQAVPVVITPATTPAAPIFMGQGALTAPMGAPMTLPTALLMGEPPNDFVPRSGTPGGSFNYNSLLNSQFKWDLQAGVRAANPLTGVDFLTIFTPNNKRGVWAWELEFSVNYPAEATLSWDALPAEGNYLLDATGGVLRLTGLRIVTGITSAFHFTSQNATVGRYAATLRLKQLTSL